MPIPISTSIPIPMPAPPIPATAYVILASVSAAAMAFFALVFFLDLRDRRRRRESLVKHAGVEREKMLDLRLECDGIAVNIIKHARSLQLASGQARTSRHFRFILRSAAHSYAELSVKAGISQAISSHAYALARLHLAFFGLCAGVLVGCFFSMELLFLLGAFGMFLGWRSVPWAFKQEIRARNNSLEKQLSEMIEVLSLGLYSGLSFDRALEMYHHHFQTSLGDATALAQRRWVCGLATREEALSVLAASYDSPLFTRVVKNIVRSLRFGARLAESLEATAVEAREIHKAKVEERVAKAPVKMLIPTGALILPAMLLLVLGPVLLNLMQGF